MKKRTIQISLALLIALAIFTIASVRIEEMMLPEVEIQYAKSGRIAYTAAALSTVTQKGGGSNILAWTISEEDISIFGSEGCEFTFVAQGKRIKPSEVVFQIKDNLVCEAVLTLDIPLEKGSLVAVSGKIQGENVYQEAILPNSCLHYNDTGRVAVIMLEEVTGVWGKELRAQYFSLTIDEQGTKTFSGNVGGVMTQYVGYTSRTIKDGERVKVAGDE